MSGEPASVAHDRFVVRDIPFITRAQKFLLRTGSPEGLAAVQREHPSDEEHSDENIVTQSQNELYDPVDRRRATNIALVPEADEEEPMRMR